MIMPNQESCQGCDKKTEMKVRGLEGLKVRRFEGNQEENSLRLRASAVIQTLDPMHKKVPTKSEEITMKTEK